MLHMEQKGYKDYKLEIVNELLSNANHIRGIAKNLETNHMNIVKRIKLAVLFGSYAKGIAKLESDIDIYIDTANKTIKGELSLINSKLSIKIGDYNKSNLLIREIEKNHVILKGVEEYYEKNKFFEQT